MAAGEEGYGFGAEDGLASVEHGLGEFGEVFGGGKKSGVWGYSAQDAGVFVLNFALDDSLAEGAAVAQALRVIRFRQLSDRSVRPTRFFFAFSFVGGGRDLCADFWWGIKCCVRHRQWGEDFAPAEAVERFVGQAFEDDAEDDESDVTVLGADSGICG